MKEIKFSETDNILLNMEGGLLPKDLTKKEMELLKKEYGKNWFEKLEFDKSGFEKPKISSK